MDNYTSFPPRKDSDQEDSWSTAYDPFTSGSESAEEIFSKSKKDIDKKVKEIRKLHNFEPTPIPNTNFVSYKADFYENKIKTLQPQLTKMYNKAVITQDYDLSLIAEVQKQIHNYEGYLSLKSKWSYITHLFSKIIGIFKTQSSETPSAEDAINLMANLWHFKLSSYQKKMVEAIMKSKTGAKVVEGTVDAKGYEYTGTFRDGIIGGIPEGKGEITYDSGKKYWGNFLNGLPHGQGEMNYKEGSEYVTYKGQFENGKPHGKGRMVDEDGTIYIGEFQNGKPHGKVRIIGDENAYLLYRDGKAIQGIVIYKDQSRFIGYFDEDEEPYNGVLTTSYGNKIEYVKGEQEDYNGTHPNRDGTTLEYKDGHPYEGFLINNLNEKLEYPNGKAYEGILTIKDGVREVYVRDEKIEDGKYWDQSIDESGLIREYKDGKLYNGIFKYPNKEQLSYVNGEPFDGILLKLNGQHLTYSDGDLLNATKSYLTTGEEIEYRDGRPYVGTLVKPDGTRIRYEDGELYNDIDNDLEYRNGRPFQGTLYYPRNDLQLEYVNGMPYEGILVKENGDRVLYKPGQPPSKPY